MVVMFASHLAVETFFNKVYLSGVRHLHVLAGLNDHFNLQLTPRLQQVLKGFQKTASFDSPPKSTPSRHSSNNMQNQRCTVTRASVLHTYSTLMLWAACELMNLTVPGTNDYNESSYLFLADILVDSQENPHLLRVKI